MSNEYINEKGKGVGYENAHPLVNYVWTIGYAKLPSVIHLNIQLKSGEIKRFSNKEGNVYQEANKFLNELK